MNVNCIICADLFMQSSETYTTKCGHIFHYQCLMQWLERSKSCPQCRQKASEKNITRIYFNFANLEGVPTDVATLQNKIDSLDLNLRLKENERREIENKFQNVCEENESLSLQISTEKEKVAKLTSTLAFLKDRLALSKVEADRAARIEEELMATKARLKDLDYLQKGLNGTFEEAQQVARDCGDKTTVAQIMVSLKKEVDMLLKKKEKISWALRKAENEAQAQKKLAEQLKQENEALTHQLREHEKCVRERHRMMRKIEQLEERRENVTECESSSKQLTDNETKDCPKENHPKSKYKDIFNDSFSIIDSPDVATRVKQIKESDSPYMQVKTNSMGILLNREGLTSKGLASKSTSIFKSIREEAIEAPKRVPWHHDHDGMGGYVRNLGSPPPINRQPQSSRPMKRTKSSTITSSKFRKLARPTQSNKIDDFLNLTGLD